MPMSEILVVDDDQSIAAAFEKFLHHDGHVCLLASNAEDAVRLVGEHQPDLVIMDVRMPGVSGLEALQTMRRLYPSVHVLIMTAHGNSQTSIDAMRAGAFEYVTKPLDLDQLRDVIARVLAAKTSLAQAPVMDDANTPPLPPEALVGETPAMVSLYKMIGTLAANDVAALIVGERGTGKELVASTIHANSARHDRPFVALDCAALPTEALEAEMFAEGIGTLYLTGIEAMPRALQARLVRALGASAGRAGAGRPVEARVLASSESPIAESIDAGTFSRELYDLLSVITVRLPPLRDRRADIPLLVKHLVQRFNVELNRSITGVDDQVMRRLQEHSWVGNVQELATVVKRAVIMARSDVITVADVEGSLRDSHFPGRHEIESALSRATRVALQERLVEMPTLAESSVFHEIVGLVEATLVKEALAITNGNQVKASELLGVNRATLRKKAASGD